MVGVAAREAFEWAASRGDRVLHVPLLGAGTTRPFAARFALAEIIRAWGRWRRLPRGTSSLEKLVIHLVSLPALFELSSGRLDVFELTSSTDLRFWIEVIKGEDIDREPMIQDESTILGELMQRLQLRQTGWRVEVEPKPEANRRDESECTRADLLSESTLLELGVLPGSTLRFLMSP